MRIAKYLTIGVLFLLFARAAAAPANDKTIFVPDYLDALASTTHGQSTETDIDTVFFQPQKSPALGAGLLDETLSGPVVYSASKSFFFSESNSASVIIPFSRRSLSCCSLV